jgi:hypothetical protein
MHHCFFASHSFKRGHFCFERLSVQSPQMVMSGLQGWNPSCRGAASDFCRFFSRTFWMFVTLDMVMIAQAKACGSL